MKKYLTKREENLMIYGGIIDTILNVLLVFPVGFLTYYQFKVGALTKLAQFNASHSKVLAGVVLSWFVLKSLVWISEAYLLARGVRLVNREEIK